MTSKNPLARASRAAAMLAACTLIGTVAQASPKDENAQRPAADKPVAEKKYCLERPSTGTMLPTRICRTAEEWRRAGVEVLRN